MTTTTSPLSNAAPVILCDTREKATPLARIIGQLGALGVETVRQKVDAGDYMLQGHPEVAVERKANLVEICQNVTQGHARFRRELLRAQEAGTHIILLIEESEIHTIEDVKNWQNPRKKYSTRCINGRLLYSSLCTIRDKYNVTITFCHPEKTGQKIMSLLLGDHPKETAINTK